VNSRSFTSMKYNRITSFPSKEFYSYENFQLHAYFLHIASIILRLNGLYRKFLIFDVKADKLQCAAGPTEVGSGW